MWAPRPLPSPLLPSRTCPASRSVIGLIAQSETPQVALSPCEGMKRGQHTALGTAGLSTSPAPSGLCPGAQQRLGEGGQPRTDVTETTETTNVLPTGATVPGPRRRRVSCPQPPTAELPVAESKCPPTQRGRHAAGRNTARPGVSTMGGRSPSPRSTQGPGRRLERGEQQAAPGALGAQGGLGTGLTLGF